MNTAILAQVLGTVFTVLGLSMLFNKKGVTKVTEELTHSAAFMWLGGLIALVIGAVIVAMNNSWTSGMPLLVTIIGWLALLKGLFLTLSPNAAVSFYKKAGKNNTFVVAGVVVLVLGLVMLF